MWQTQYSDYSLKNCSWREGKGDVVREYLDAMREYDIRTGLYYSPADQVIFTSKLSMEAHNELIRNHLREICSNYGPIDYLWFDNCGSDKCVYDWDRITTEVIRPNQPDTVVNSNGDVQSCWVGNEAGYAPCPCKYVIDVEKYGTDRLSKAALDRAENGKLWSPAEADFMLDERSWFHREKGHTIKSLDVLMGIYYRSVGRGINMLMNIGPDTRGLLPEADSERLLEFGNEIKKRFSNQVGGLNDMQVEGNTYTLKLQKPAPIDHIVLCENITKGHRVGRYVIKAESYLGGQDSIIIHEGTGIGYKAVIPFPTMYTPRLTIEILEPGEGYEIKEIRVYGTQ